MTKMTIQKQTIKNHLYRFNKITSMEAFTLYKITRLSAHIYELRHTDGINILSINKPCKPCGRYVEYMLVSKLSNNK